MIYRPQSHENPLRRHSSSAPSKTDVIAVVVQDSGRAGLQLEWMLDHLEKRESDR